MSSDVQQRQNQTAGIHLLQSNKEESSLCEKEKESGALEQNPKKSNPASQSDDLQQGQNATMSIKRQRASDIVKEETKSSNQENQHDKITEKLRNADAVRKLQADEESIPCGIPKTLDDALMHKSERIVSVKKEKATDDVQSLVSDIPASQCRQQKSSNSNLPEKALANLDIVATPSSFVPVIPKQESEQCSLLCNEEKSVSLEKNILSDDNFPQIPTSEQHHFSFSAKPEKAEKLPPRRNPDPGVQGSQSDPESKVPEKAVDDGYNWRKYGQKLVKGNEFIRSYYRCTFPNCLAKKQLERSHDGNLKDINYLGNHEHPKPQHSPHVPAGLLVRRLESSASGAVSEPIIARDNASQCTEVRESTQPSPIAETADGEAGAVENCNENAGCPDLKRQKTEISSAVDNLLNKPNIESRHVVHTISEVDTINDGYRWRKYGQKFVKGNPNPRSYYRCTYAGCPVKKHVERASHDQKMVITTYEGQHEHGVGMTSSSSSSKTAAGTESRSTHPENKPVGLDMAVHISANS